MERPIKPILAYRCPKDGKLVEYNDCRKCPYFAKAEWHEHQWTIFCRYR